MYKVVMRESGVEVTVPKQDDILRKVETLRRARHLWPVTASNVLFVEIQTPAGDRIVIDSSALLVRTYMTKNKIRIGYFREADAALEYTMKNHGSDPLARKNMLAYVNECLWLGVCLNLPDEGTESKPSHSLQYSTHEVYGGIPEIGLVFD